MAANIDYDNLDPDVVKLAQSIRQVESNNNFNAVGDNGESHGAYQFNKGNFAHWATQFGLDPNDFSPKNQDRVAYAKMKTWKDQGYHAGEIAAMWNGAHMQDGRPVANNPEYVKKVEAALKQVPGLPSAAPAAAFNPAPFSSGAVSGPEVPSVQEDIKQNVKSGAKSFAKGILPALGNFGVGVVKGVGNLENDTLGKLADKILPPNPGTSSATQQERQQMTPKGTSQKVGNVVGKYVLPAVAATTTGGAALEGAVPGLVSEGVPTLASKGSSALKSGKGLIGKALGAYGALEAIKHSPLKGILKVLLEAL